MENNGELQLYSYTLSNGKVNRRFEKFWTWLQRETTAFRIPNNIKMLNIFKEILYLEDQVYLKENRGKLRELQKLITYSKNDIMYPKAWINIDLTNEIIKKFIESNNFEEEIIEYSSLDDDIHKNDIYQEIYNILKEGG
ncbi:hypothetical protein RclHR1_07420004 [Rhizophagus clarus]|uniref:Uncharacterized protein n=1 Tax=Rhizophagus clarus TaxID=94130 RepID=A0A2Z6SC65_9GLOM|nr:hypothetical protein RclHR1_07420004 [Rhizophagus clarus]GES81741.1 hypothetical protein GLOIN_2v1791382 [Rhizophagus clarus]